MKKKSNIYEQFIAAKNCENVFTNVHSECHAVTNDITQAMAQNLPHFQIIIIAGHEMYSISTQD